MCLIYMKSGLFYTFVVTIMYVHLVYIFCIYVWLKVLISFLFGYVCSHMRFSTPKCRNK